jgi:hypothetical protein
MKRILAFAAGTALALGTIANAEAHDFGHDSWGGNGGSWHYSRPTWGQSLAAGAIAGVAQAITEAALTPQAPTYSAAGLPWPASPALPAYYPAASGPYYYWTGQYYATSPLPPVYYPVAWGPGVPPASPAVVVTPPSAAPYAAAGVPLTKELIGGLTGTQTLTQTTVYQPVHSSWTVTPHG